MSLRRFPAARRISGSAAPAFCVTGERAAGWSYWPPYFSVRGRHPGRASGRHQQRGGSARPHAHGHAGKRRDRRDVSVKGSTTKPCCASRTKKSTRPPGRPGRDAMIAYSTNEPFVLEQLGAAYRTFAPAASGIDFYGDNLCTSEAEVKTHPV